MATINSKVELMNRHRRHRLPDSLPIGYRWPGQIELPTGQQQAVKRLLGQAPHTSFQVAGIGDLAALRSLEKRFN